MCFDFCWGLLLLLLLLFLLMWFLLFLSSLFLFFLLLKIFFNIAISALWFRVSISNQNFTDGFLVKFFFLGRCSRHLQRSALFTLLCMTGHNFSNLMLLEYEHLLQWQQNRSKGTMWLLYKNSSYSRVPKILLLHWWLYVACYYPTTSTNYPSTTRGVSVGPSIAVNIEFCGYLWFLSITFVWIIWVQYAIDILSAQEKFLAS